MKLRREIEAAVRAAIEPWGDEAAAVPVVLERPRDASHGDMSTPVAMSLARILRRRPVDIAEELASRIMLPADRVAAVDVAAPGFVNFRFADDALRESVRAVLDAGERYGSVDVGHGARVQCEYVSANPTGPLVVVSARAAAVGAAIVNLLRFAGFDARGEYYVNDWGGQVERLGESVRWRLRERLGMLAEGEEIGAYPGEYLREVAATLDEATARRWADAAADAHEIGRWAAGVLLERIRRDLDDYGVHFDSFFSEATLHPDATARALERFVEAGVTYEKDGAVYFRSTDFGDDKDRVLRKRTGDDTYFLADVAYHLTKLERGFVRAIGLLGPDHHGHVPRMRAAMRVLGAPDDWLEIIIVGWVRLMEEGRPVSMSKRAGEFITLRELIEDVGPDVARYFFLMRRANSPLDFDLTLARRQSDDNPVYYVQYAHARISSVVRFARERGVDTDVTTTALDRLAEPEERALMLELAYFPHVVEGAALAREPHRLTQYAQGLATAFHQFYHACRIVTDDAERTGARLALAEATRQTLRNALELLGVSAPESM